MFGYGVGKLNEIIERDNLDGAERPSLWKRLFGRRRP